MKKRGLPYLDAVVGDIITIEMDEMRAATVNNIVPHKDSHYYSCTAHYGHKDIHVNVFRGEVLAVMSGELDALVKL